MDEKQLLTSITQSFNGSLPPTPLIRPECIAIYEALDVADAFGTFTWEQIDPSLLLAHKGAIPYFSDVAFIHFLPAYLHLIVSDIEESDVLADVVIEKLSLPSGLNILQEYQDYLKHRAEKGGINLEEHFSAYFDKPVISAAIHRYWFQFQENP